MTSIKKNDKVKILSGKDKGKQGRVLVILPKKGKVMVEGIAIVSRHTKPRKQGQSPAIIKRESYIDISKVAKIA